MKKLLFALCACVSLLASAAQRQKLNFNSDWLLMIGDIAGAEASAYDDADWQKVTLPRAFNEDEAYKLPIAELTDTVVWYRKHFSGNELVNRKVLAEFEGVRFAADFYLNGHHLGLHENGVMAVGLDLTPYMQKGDNVLAVRVDNDWAYREKAYRQRYQWNDRNFNANYGGIPKNVWLHVCEPVYQTLPLYSNLGTTGTYVYATDIDIPSASATIHAEAQVKNETSTPQRLALRATLTDADGRRVGEWQGDFTTIQPGKMADLKAQSHVDDLHFWSWGYGYLYTLTSELVAENGRAFDRVDTRTGFRKTRFGEGKVWLNDRVIQLKGYAQRTSNEWPGVGMSVPAWLSDYSNAMVVEGNGNLVRWMHVTPWKQDVESCDRVGLIQAMPAGDSERDCDGRRWEQRMLLMRDAIIYNRNNPSIIFYESGNESISRDHMLQMKAIRDMYDPHGGRAIGSREMLDIDDAEYGGEMLYINKSHKHPMWATEYCRDEGMRIYWDEYSYPYHREGAGPLYKGKPAYEYNHNMDCFAVELVHRWYDYYRERPGTGTRVSSGGAKIIFSDTNTHCRGEENYRRSGVTDAMRIPKDAYFAHKVMWGGWVDSEEPGTHIVGHWNYSDTVTKPVYVVSNADNVELLLNGRSVGMGKQDYQFLFTFPAVKYEAGELVAIGRDATGAEQSRHSLTTAGEPVALRLNAITNPQGWRADGADMALIEVEVVDKDGNRSPLDNRIVRFSVQGPAEWRGGIAKGPDNYVLSTSLPVECGINRALVRSLTTPGEVVITAEADGLPAASLTLATAKHDSKNGMSSYNPSLTLPCRLQRGPTPEGPSYADTLTGAEIATISVGSNAIDARNCCDDNELSEWASDGRLDNAWATFALAEKAEVKEVCVKLTGWRNKSYPIEVLAGDQVVWSGETPKSLGYVHLPLSKHAPASAYTIRLVGSADAGADAFGQITEVAGGRAAELDFAGRAQSVPTLRIVEVEFLK